jgi:hypothetical protein
LLSSGTMSGLPDPSDKVEPGKEEGSRTRIVHETGCNQILVCFLLAKSPTTGPNVLKIPFSEVTPISKYRKFFCTDL